MGLLTQLADPYAGRMTEAPKFGMFVRSVKGRTVPRYGTPGLIGAERVACTKEERRRGTKSPVLWFPERVTPLSTEYCRRYRRELAGHLRNGDLREATEQEWQEQVKREAAQEAARKAAAKKAQEAAAEAATKAAGEGAKPENPVRKKAAKKSGKESEQ